MTRSRAAGCTAVPYECRRRNRPLSTLVRVEHSTDRVDGKIEAARGRAVGGLETVAARGLRIEIRRQLGAIGAECLNLRGEFVLAVIGLAPDRKSTRLNSSHVSESRM